MTSAPRDGERPPNGARVDVSVLTPVLNEEAFIRDTVAAMRKQQFEGEIEFLFMDGRSEDRTRAVLEEVAAEDRRIRVLDNPDRRTAHGLNVGLSNARGDFIARMDAHTYYPPDYLAKGVERLRRGDVEWVSGPQTPRGAGDWSRRVALALGSPLGVGGSKKWATDREIELDSGVFCGVWRRATLEQYGGWDEGWPVNQDSELAARFQADGRRLVCLPELAADYVPRDSLKLLARQYWRYGYYRAKTSRRHPHSMRRSHVLAPGLTLTLACALLGPRKLRPFARAGAAAYVVAAVGTSIRIAERPRDRAALPLVFATMHVAWGLGFLVGSVAFGPPLAGLARLMRPGTGGGES
jgi:succinoglycan biosynthesis protein ExoA